MYARSRSGHPNIEGTCLATCSHSKQDSRARVIDTREVLAYVRAMNAGTDELQRLPSSLRLIRMIYAELMRDAWYTPPSRRVSVSELIGPVGFRLRTRPFVPPAVPDMTEALGQLESFFTNAMPYQPQHCASPTHSSRRFIHSWTATAAWVDRRFQFVERGTPHKPLLYFASHFFVAKSGAEYYDRADGSPQRRQLGRIESFPARRRRGEPRGDVPGTGHPEPARRPPR